MKWHKYKKLVSGNPWIETVVIALARRYDMIGENETPSRDFVRHQIDGLALHSVHQIDWDRKGGQEVNGVSAIQLWIPFSSVSSEGRCSLPISNAYGFVTAKRAVEQERLIRGDLRVTIDCLAWFKYTLGQTQSSLRLDLYQTAIYLGNQN